MSAHDAHRRLQHDAIFYEDESSFAASAASFVREGIERDEIVLVNTGAHPVASLLRAMFRDEEQVVFAEKAVYNTPAEALDRYRRTFRRGLAEGVDGYRAIGHIDFAGSPLPWQEWLRYEAAVNRVFAEVPLRTLCPYDTTSVPPEVADAILRAHPGLVGPDGRHVNDRYVEPERLVVEPDLVTPPHPLQGTTPRMVLHPEDDLADLRLEVYSATMFTSLPSRKVDDLVAAVGELVANARKHGASPVTLRLWAAESVVVCTVTDQGSGIDDPLVGYDRPRRPSGGLGLWAARQLVDVLDYSRDEDGFTARVISYV